MIRSNFQTTAYGHPKGIVSALLNPAIGYLRIPTNPDSTSEGDEGVVKEIQEHVCTLISNRVESWIIDLRLNGGTSMFSFLSGVYELFGNRRIGSFVGEDGELKRSWSLKDGNFYLEKKQQTFQGRKCTDSYKPTKIAILISPLTSHAGEAVAIALRGLPNTRIFGERSRGFITALHGVMPENGTTFYISTSYQSDLTGRIYKEFIIPDVEIKQGDDFQEIENDQKVMAAIHWITSPIKRPK